MPVSRKNLLKRKPNPDAQLKTLSNQVSEVVDGANLANNQANTTTDVAYTDSLSMYPIDHLHELQPLAKADTDVTDEATTYPTAGGLTNTAAAVGVVGFLALVGVLVIYGQR